MATYESTLSVTFVAQREIVSIVRYEQVCLLGKYLFTVGRSHVRRVWLLGNCH